MLLRDTHNLHERPRRRRSWVARLLASALTMPVIATAQAPPPTGNNLPLLPIALPATDEAEEFPPGPSTPVPPVSSGPTPLFADEPAPGPSPKDLQSLKAQRFDEIRRRIEDLKNQSSQNNSTPGSQPASTPFGPSSVPSSQPVAPPDPFVAPRTSERPTAPAGSNAPGTNVQPPANSPQTTAQPERPQRQPAPGNSPDMAAVEEVIEQIERDPVVDEYDLPADPQPAQPDTGTPADNLTNAEPPPRQMSADEAALAQLAETNVVSGTIDRFSLACSLFGTGDIKLCEKILADLNKSELPRGDQLFAEYLQACCHRKQGQVSEAERIYRRLLAEPDAEWIGELARWWLTNLDEKRRLQDDAQRLGSTLQAWEKEIEQLKPQQP